MTLICSSAAFSTRLSAQTAVVVQPAKGVTSGSDSKPDVTGAWAIETGEWKAGEGATVTVNAAIVGLVFSTAGDTVIAKYRSATGAVGKSQLKGVWTEGRLKLTSSLPMKQEQKDEEGNVQSQTPGTASFEVELIPDGEELKGTIRIVGASTV